MPLPRVSEEESNQTPTNLSIYSSAPTQIIGTTTEVCLQRAPDMLSAFLVHFAI